MIINDPNCSDTITKINYVRINITNADFTTTNDTFCFGESIKFTNTSTGASSFSWDFDDGSPRSFTKDPSHVFRDSGWFDVTMVASAGSACIDQIIKQIYIQKVEADFDIVPAYSCQLPDSIQFIDRSFRAFSYDWRIPELDKDLDDTSFLYTIKDPIHIMTDTGTFNDTLIITSQFGCKDTAIKSIRRGEELVTKILLSGNRGTSDNYGGCPPLVVTATDSTYGAGNIVSYFWDLGGGVTYNGQFPPPVRYDTAGVFNIILTVTNDSGCTDVDTSAIYVVDQEDPAFTVEPDTVCQGDTVTITMTNSNGVEYFFSIYTQKYSLGYTEDAINVGYFNRYKDTGYHSVYVKAGDICDTVLTLDSAFYVLGPVHEPQARSNCINPRQIEFKGNLYGTTRFYWDFGDGSPIDSINETPIHTYPKDTIFQVILTAYNDTNKCPFYSDTIFVDLSLRLPPTQLPYQKYNCRDGNLIRLYYNNTLEYDSSHWYLNGSFLGDFEDNKFPKDIFPNGKSEIMLIGTNELGCKDTIYDFIFISDPRVNFGSVIQGGCIPFDAQMVDSSYSDTTLLSWQWFFSHLPNDTFTTQNPIVTVNTTNNIVVRLKVKDYIGCEADTMIDDLITGGTLEVDFSMASDPNICQGDSIQFFNRSNGNNYISIWDFGDGVLDTINTPSVFHQFNTAGTFEIQLVIVDQSGCRDTLKRYNINVEAKPTASFIADTTIATCYPFAVNFIDQSIGNIDYWQWDLGSNDSIVIQDPFRNFLSPGNFDIQLIVETVNGCRDTLRRNNYIQITGPTATFDVSKNVICLNEPITFTITSQNGVGNYRWAFGDGNSSTANPVTHIYTDTSGLIQPSLIIRDSAGGCEVIILDSIRIQEVIAKFSLEDTTGCEPFSPKITNLMQGEDSFLWDLGDGRTSTDRVPQLTYDQNGSYDLKLSVSSNIGCTDDATVTIDVFETPVAQVNGNTNLCAGDSTTLSGSGGTVFKWFNDGVMISNSASIRIGPDSTSTYLFVTGNQFNCEDTVEVDVYVQQAPNYQALLDSTIIIGEKIDLNVFAGIGFNYSWRPPTGLSCTDCYNPAAQPLETTEYYLTISDPNGCFTILDTVLITVIEEFTLDVPQAFSPNGDGVNDVIYVKGWGLKELISFKIYNRFGELVFESNDFNIGWDGTYNGQDQMLETYVYTVEARTWKDRVLQKKGNITLLR